MSRSIRGVADLASVAAIASCESKQHVVGSINTEFKLIGPDQMQPEPAREPLGPASTVESMPTLGFHSSDFSARILGPYPPESAGMISRTRLYVEHAYTTGPARRDGD